MPPSSPDPRDIFQAACEEMAQAAASPGAPADDGPAQRRLRQVVGGGTPPLPADFNTRLLQKWHNRMQELPASPGRGSTAGPGTVWRAVRRFIGEILRDHGPVIGVAVAAVVVLIGVRALIEPPTPPEYATDVTRSPAPGTAMSPPPPAQSDLSSGETGATGVGSAIARTVLADWHVAAHSDPVYARFNTWPKEAKGTVWVDLPDIAPEDRPRLRITFLLNEPGEKRNGITATFSGGSVTRAERWAGARVQVEISYPGGEAALWKKYPSGLHIRLLATGEG